MPAGGRSAVVVVRGPGAPAYLSLAAEAGAEPYLDPGAGRTVVPLRSLFTALSPGADAVTWDGGLRTAGFRFRGHTLTITVPQGSVRASRVEGDGQRLDVPATLCNGKLYAPLHTVAAQMGFSIRWMGDAFVAVDALGSADAPEVSEADRDSLVNAAYSFRVSRAETPARITARASAALSPCENIPERMLDIFLSPADSFQQAARATACRLVAGM